MKKFVLLAIGYTEPTNELMAAWGKWFESIKGNIVDQGNPFGLGREITTSGAKDLPTGMDAITGYVIINAEDMQAAKKIAQSAPLITGMRVYEAMKM